MPIEETLARIEEETAGGDLGKAHDRLHGLLSSYPADLTLRRQLGAIYWQLQYPEMAGRYWYLEEEKSPQMMVACQAFEQSCGNDPWRILASLKFHADPASLDSDYARDTLLALRDRTKTWYGRALDFGKRGAGQAQSDELGKTADRWISIGCAVLILAAVALTLVGFVAVIRWMFFGG